MNSREAGRARWCKSLFFIAYALMLLALTLGVWVWTPEGRQPSVTIWVVKLLPLLAFLPGLLRDDLHAYLWFCLVVLLYFVIAVTGAMSPYGTVIHIAELTLAVVLFISGMLFVRWHARARRRELAGE